MMIAEFTNNHKLDAKNIGETIFKLHEKIEHLQAQIDILTKRVSGTHCARGTGANRRHGLRSSGASLAHPNCTD